VRFNSFAWLLSLVVTSTAVAQSSGDIAYFHVNRAKPSMTAQYEAARKRHWVWHKKMGDEWAFHVWQIVSGEASGTYIVCSFGHSWKEVDESDQLVGGEEDDPAAKVEPYLDAGWESYYRYLPTLSIAPKEGFSPSAKLAVTRWLLKHEEVESFIAAQLKIRDALAKLGYVGRVRWFQLVNGGETPQFLMLVDRDNWAAYEQAPEENLCGIMEKTYGKRSSSQHHREGARGCEVAVCRDVAVPT
jgi:hypothetical protein